MAGGLQKAKTQGALRRGDRALCLVWDSVTLSNRTCIMTSNAELLRRYATENDDSAFAEFVQRHLPVNCSAAARRLNGDTHRAGDVAQIVFANLAREAGRVSRSQLWWMLPSARCRISAEGVFPPVKMCRLVFKVCA